MRLQGGFQNVHDALRGAVGIEDVGDLVEVGPGLSQLGLGRLQGVTGPGALCVKLSQELFVGSWLALAGQGITENLMDYEGGQGMAMGFWQLAEGFVDRER